MHENESRTAVGPPPRAVPLALRLRLLTNRWALIGALVSGTGGLFATPLVLAANPLGAWRLAGGTSEAPGELLAVEDMHYEENHVKVFRCRYVFPTPDGARHLGRCYMAAGQLAPPPRAAEHDPKQRPRVNVVYSPEHPETSYIKGLSIRPINVNLAVGWSLIALYGLAIQGFGLARGLGKVRLLAQGKTAQATLVSVRQAIWEANGTSFEIPFALFRHDRLAEAQGGEVFGTASLAPAGNPSTSDRAAWFISLWTCGGMLILICGIFVIVGGITLMFVGPHPVFVNGKPIVSRLALPLFWAGFLVLWLIVGTKFLQFGSLDSAVAPIKVVPFGTDPNAIIICTFDYHIPEGRVVRAEDTVTFRPRLGEGPTEPVLYEPAYPEKALLVYGLAPAVRVTEFGEWQGGPVPWLGLALIVVCLIGGPYAGWTIWNLFP